MKDKIMSSLWFNAGEGKLLGLLESCKNIFGDSFKFGNISVINDMPDGHAEFYGANIFGQEYSSL